MVGRCPRRHRRLRSLPCRRPVTGSLRTTAVVSVAASRSSCTVQAGRQEGRAENHGVVRDYRLPRGPTRRDGTHAGSTRRRDATVAFDGSGARCCSSPTAQGVTAARSVSTSRHLGFCAPDELRGRFRGAAAGLARDARRCARTARWAALHGAQRIGFAAGSRPITNRCRRAVIAAWPAGRSPASNISGCSTRSVGGIRRPPLDLCTSVRRCAHRGSPARPRPCIRCCVRPCSAR